MGELNRTMKRIEGKLDAVTGDHETRIRGIEKWMWTLFGIGTTGAVSGMGALITGLVGV